MDTIAKGQRVTGDWRLAVAGPIVAAYECGFTVRAIANELGRSYGFVYRILNENEVVMRSRGGDNHKGNRN